MRSLLCLLLWSATLPAYAQHAYDLANSPVAPVQSQSFRWASIIGDTPLEHVGTIGSVEDPPIRIESIAPDVADTAPEQKLVQLGDLFTLRLRDWKKEVSSLRVTLTSDCDYGHSFLSGGATKEGNDYIVEFVVPPDADLCQYSISNVEYQTEDGEPALDNDIYNWRVSSSSRTATIRVLK